MISNFSDEMESMFAIAFTCVRQFIDSKFVFKTTEEEIKQTQYQHIEIEKLLKIQPLLCFMKRIKECGNSIVHIDEIRALGFGQIQVEYFMQQLEQCKFLVPINDAEFQINSLFLSEREVVYRANENFTNNFFRKQLRQTIKESLELKCRSLQI